MLDLQAARVQTDDDAPKQDGRDHPTTIPTGMHWVAHGHLTMPLTENAFATKFRRALVATEMIAAHAAMMDATGNYMISQITAPESMRDPEGYTARATACFDLQNCITGRGAFGVFRKAEFLGAR